MADVTELTSPDRHDGGMNETRPRLWAWLTVQGALIVVDQTGREVAMTRANLADLPGQLRAMGYVNVTDWDALSGGTEIALVEPVN